MLPCTSAADPGPVLGDQRAVDAELVVERRHGGLGGERPEDRPAGIAGQHLPGQEDDHAEDQQSDDGEPETPQDVQRQRCSSAGSLYNLSEIWIREILEGEALSGKSDPDGDTSASVRNGDSLRALPLRTWLRNTGTAMTVNLARFGRMRTDLR